MKEDDFLDILKKLGRRIEQIREFQNISIMELSVLTGIKKEYLKKIENGAAKRLNVVQFFSIAKALNVKGCELVNFNKRKKR